MKITLPEIEINPDGGFDPKIDIFRQEAFGERLANLIENAGDNPVIVLDSGWGEGRTTFIKMWRGYLSQRDPQITSIYSDVFENDYQADPFFLLAFEIYCQLTQGDEKIEFYEKIKPLLDDEDSGRNKFVDALKRKNALKEFKKYLSDFANKPGNDKPIVFIIDELDRCHSDFILRLLEQIKRVFSVKNITFLLVASRDRIEKSVRAEYGMDIDSTDYLHKFINIWVSFNTYNNSSDYLKYVFKKISESEEDPSRADLLNILLDSLKKTIEYYQPSLQSTQRILSYFAIIYNKIKTIPVLGSWRVEYPIEYRFLTPFVCFLKVYKPQLLTLFINDKIAGDEFIESSGLSSINNNSNISLRNIKEIIENEFDKEEHKIETGIGIISLPKDKSIMKTIISYLSDLSEIKHDIY